MDSLNRTLFAFASYNAGPARVAKLRAEATEMGLNPNMWFNNVEVVAAKDIGRETVTYVRNIYKYYVAYVLVAEQEAARRERPRAGGTPAQVSDRPLRIAMVIDSWDDAANGAVISTRRFTDLLREHGHTVTILAAGEPAPGKVVLRPFYIPFANDIMRKMRLPFAWPTPAIIDATLAKQDIVHVQFPFYLGVKAITTARRLGKPVVSTFHVQAEHLLYNIGVRNQGLVEQVYRFFLRTIYDRSDHVVCPSAFAERELTSRGLKVPTSVISNGVPPEFRPVPPGVGRLTSAESSCSCRSGALHARSVTNSSSTRSGTRVIATRSSWSSWETGRCARSWNEKGQRPAQSPGIQLPQEGGADPLVRGRRSLRSRLRGGGRVHVGARGPGVRASLPHRELGPERHARSLLCRRTTCSNRATGKTWCRKIDALVDQPARLQADREAVAQRGRGGYSIEASLEKLLRVYRRTGTGLNVSQLQPFPADSRLTGVDLQPVSIAPGLACGLSDSPAHPRCCSAFIASPAHPQAPPPASRPGATAVAASDTTATARHHSRDRGEPAGHDRPGLAHVQHRSAAHRLGQAAARPRSGPRAPWWRAARRTCTARRTHLVARGLAGLLRRDSSPRTATPSRSRRSAGPNRRRGR